MKVRGRGSVRLVRCHSGPPRSVSASATRVCPTMRYIWSVGLLVSVLAAAILVGDAANVAATPATAAGRRADLPARLQSLAAELDGPGGVIDAASATALLRRAARALRMHGATVEAGGTAVTELALARHDLLACQQECCGAKDTAEAAHSECQRDLASTKRDRDTSEARQRKARRDLTAARAEAQQCAERLGKEQALVKALSAEAAQSRSMVAVPASVPPPAPSPHELELLETTQELAAAVTSCETQQDTICDARVATASKNGEVLCDAKVGEVSRKHTKSKVKWILRSLVAGMLLQAIASLTCCRGRCRKCLGPGELGMLPAVEVGQPVKAARPHVDDVAAKAMQHHAKQHRRCCRCTKRDRWWGVHRAARAAGAGLAVRDAAAAKLPAREAPSRTSPRAVPGVADDPGAGRGGRFGPSDGDGEPEEARPAFVRAREASTRPAVPAPRPSPAANRRSHSGSWFGMREQLQMEADDSEASGLLGAAEGDYRDAAAAASSRGSRGSAASSEAGGSCSTLTPSGRGSGRGVADSLRPRRHFGRSRS